MTAYKISAPATNIKQQAEAEALFTSIGDGAISTDEFGKITRVNPVAQRLLGYKADELIGQWFPKAIVALNAEGTPLNLIDRPITKAFLTGHSIFEKTFYRRKDGELIPVAVNVAPVILNDKPLGAIEVFRDITLEEEIDRMKSEFISLASHQLRTPLSAIKTYSHMLIEGYMGEVTAPQKKSLRTIIGGANRMNELISTLLNITRIESGTIAVSPRQLNLENIVQDVGKELSLMAQDKEIELAVSTKGRGSTTVTSDALIAKEVITNLATNAIKYTPEKGGVSIEVRPRNADVVIAVSDTGWGIPKYAQEQIFTKFFRAANIVKRETTGTGLGLYLVKGLVELLGGTITFTSSEGEGTTFLFSLPRLSETMKDMTPPAKAKQ